MFFLSLVCSNFEALFVRSSPVDAESQFEDSTLVDDEIVVAELSEIGGCDGAAIEACCCSAVHLFADMLELHQEPEEPDFPVQVGVLLALRWGGGGSVHVKQSHALL